MIVATANYDDGTCETRAFKTREGARRYSEEECKWEGTLYVELKGLDRDGNRLNERHDGEFV